MKKQVKVNKPKVSGDKAPAKKKSAKKVLDDFDGITEVIVVDDGIFDIVYDEALLEEAAVIAALEELGYDVVLTDCNC